MVKYKEKLFHSFSLKNNHVHQWGQKANLIIARKKIIELLKKLGSFLIVTSDLKFRRIYWRNEFNVYSDLFITLLFVGVY